MPELHLPAAQAAEVCRILQAHLPPGTRVRVFGSRATGHRLKPHSDLDLLIDSPAELPLIAWAGLREALTESDLPVAVDLVDRRDLGDVFLERFAQEGSLELLVVG